MATLITTTAIAIAVPCSPLDSQLHRPKIQTYDLQPPHPCHRKTQICRLAGKLANMTLHSSPKTHRQCSSSTAVTCQAQTMPNTGNSEGSSPEKVRRLEQSKFARLNPMTDTFHVLGYHHVEFWCSDATNTFCRFSHGLGMQLASQSDLSTGNLTHASYLLRSSNLRFLFTAPYPGFVSSGSPEPTASIPSFDAGRCRRFAEAHGLGVRAVALEVEDVVKAFAVSVENGARPAFEPVELGDGEATMAEVELYGDVVLRYIGRSKGSVESGFLPGFQESGVVDGGKTMGLGLTRLDHTVGIVERIGPAVDYIKGFTGFHKFAEYTDEDVRTSESGMNSMVLANNNEMVLLPILEPVSGKRNSQIQTFMDHNLGPGLQHLALASDDAIATVREMRRRTATGGFDFMPPPPPTYYTNLRRRAGDVLSEEQMAACEELGIMVDRDDQGVVLQIFTKPVGDRPTMFVEIIQRIGCMEKDKEGEVYQKGGCGGFGKGNVSELFKSVEEYEKLLEAKQKQLH